MSCKVSSDFYIKINIFHLQKFLVVTIVFIFLLFFETIRSRRLMFFIIGLIECYFWLCVFSLSQIYKINERINRQFYAINLDLDNVHELKVWVIRVHLHAW